MLTIPPPTPILILPIYAPEVGRELRFDFIVAEALDVLPAVGVAAHVRDRDLACVYVSGNIQKVDRNRYARKNVCQHKIKCVDLAVGGGARPRFAGFGDGVHLHVVGFGATQLQLLLADERQRVGLTAHTRACLVGPAQHRDRPASQIRYRKPSPPSRT